jgi:cation:H+ antiporter
MTVLILETILMLVVILAAAELFTNSLEHLGQRLGISQGVTGSVFAAVGTAMPETLVPILAITAGTASAEVNEEIGVGAILGAPLMLSTIATFLMAASVTRRRGLKGHIMPEHTGFNRDLNFFLVAFALAAVAMYVPPHARVVRVGIGIVLVLLYFLYLMLTLRASEKLVADGHATEADAPLFFCRAGLPDRLPVYLLQLAMGLGLLVFGAKGFVVATAGLAKELGVTALLISLLVVPIATELPEKINSISWIRRRKDTLAFGNITGAMVFQGTLLPAIGIMLTPWVPRVEVLSGVFLTLVAAAWLRLTARAGGAPVWTYLVNGLFYVMFLVLTLAR